MAVIALAAVAGLFALWRGTSTNAPIGRPASALEERRAGLAAYEQGRDAEAVEAYERALALEDDLATRTNLGNALKRLGRTDEASRQYRHVLRQNPRDAVTWYDLGNLLHEQMHDARGAVEAYRRATEIDPQMADAHFRLGVVLMELGDFEPAVAVIQTALQVAPPGTAWRADAEGALAQARLRSLEQQGLLPPPRK